MTNVKLVKDCGLYPSYKKIIDFTGSKSEIIRKQLDWIDSFNHIDIQNVNYNKFQNKLTLPIDYEEALTYTYAVLTDITGTDIYPQFFFIEDVENLTNGISEAEPNIAISLTLDPIMTYMGDWKLDECLVNRSHTDRWENNHIKRITPNIEGVDGYNITEAVHDLNSKFGTGAIGLCVLTFTSPYIRMKVTRDGGSQDFDEELDEAVYQGVFLVNLSRPDVRIQTKVDMNIYYTGPPSDTRYHLTSVQFPSLNDVITGKFQSNLPIVDDSIVSFTITPITLVDLDVVLESGIIYVNLKDYIPEFNIHFDYTISRITWDIGKIQLLYSYKDRIEYGLNSGQINVNFNDIPFIIFKDLTAITSDSKTISVPWNLPVVPSDNSVKSDIYEPALYKSPYRVRKIVKGDGTTILEIPDIDIENTNITGKQIITSAGITNLFVHGDSVNISSISEGEMGTDSSTTLDVLNDQWKTYVYTRKDTDRQIVMDMAWKQALDNLFFMSYGGALVGSRSAGEEGYLNRAPVERVRNRDSKGRFAPGWKEIGGNVTGLTATGTRVLGAVGLAAGASIVTSLIDAHFMWDAQMQKEKQIRNEPTKLTILGEGMATVLSGMADYYLVEQKIDDINYERAYENFWKYGYWINKFEKPDISSRKYFNYILTNGAIVNGSINQAIRDVIASIFDAGVTIFHYDSGDSKVRRLEYPDLENIEKSLSPEGSIRYRFPPLHDNHTISAEITHV